MRARPIEGAATAAAERVLAEALGLRPRQVRVVRGATSRDKLVEITRSARRTSPPGGPPCSTSERRSAGAHD